MKASTKPLAIFAMFLAATVPPMFAQLNIPSDCSDDALLISNNTVIDPIQANAATGIRSRTTLEGFSLSTLAIQQTKKRLSE